MTLEELREQVLADMTLGTKPASLYDLLKPRVDKALRAAEQRGIERAAKHIKANFEMKPDYENCPRWERKRDPKTGYTEGTSYDPDDIATELRALAQGGE